MQIVQKTAQILSPFKDQAVSFSVVGKEEADPVSLLFPEELLLINGTESQKWKEEYARGRLAGRRALGKFSEIDNSILKGVDGEPLFPDGFVGSISHSAGVGVACASSCSSYRGLGIDMENVAKKRQEGIFRKIATSAEQAWIFEEEQEICRRGVLIFSIKESIYKAMFQAFKVKLKYMDAEVSPDLESGEASIEILKEGFDKEQFNSGFSFIDEFVISGVGVL